MVTVNWSKTVTGRAVIMPVVQAAVGGQVVVTPQIKGGGVFKFLRDHVQIGIQGMGTANLPAVPPPAAPFAPGPSVGGQGAGIFQITW
jgi:hypothetical protein